ncbi:MAG: methylmalonyl-CoA mutase family protein [Streptosporangiaceae bacterium]
MTRESESGLPIEPVYGPGSLTGFDPRQRLGEPGEYPFTRGVHASMYVERPWTMRQYAGFATAAESNRRYHQLIQAGTTGLSVAFDLPTQMGFDSDAAMALGEVGTTSSRSTLPAAPTSTRRNPPCAWSRTRSPTA